MFTAKFDMPKMERSLKKASRAFGDTSAQAVARWGVQTCRELARSTQAWGEKNTTELDPSSGEKTKTGPRMQQEGAILRDALNVIRVTSPEHPQKVKRGQELNSTAAVFDWIEINRTGRKGHTARIPTTEKKDCERRIFDRAMRIRFKLAGMAKGGWLGAGTEIANAQVGTYRISVGKNYLNYAQKHSRLGSAKLHRNAFSPFAILTNRAKHTSSGYVVKKGDADEAIRWGLVKAVRWYEKSLKGKLDSA